MNWAVETPVKLGQRTGTLVEIKQGLKEGDKVIGKFDQNLRAGSKASIKNKRFALFMEQPLIVVKTVPSPSDSTA